MIVLSGGTGTPKLLLGLKELLPPSELSVVVNTAEDLWISGNLVSPDLDTVLYTLAGLVDQQRWWGIKEDSFHTHDFLEIMGKHELLSLGEKDRAVQIFRSDQLRKGASLSSATENLAKAFGIIQRIIPMSDDPVSTIVTTDSGDMHFQDFWVGLRGMPEVLSLRFNGIKDARPSPGFLQLLEREDIVLIGPSNPVTSIGPILALQGIRARLRDKKVVAVSPMVEDRPVSGPAAKFMQACGFPATNEGVLSILGKVDLFIVDKTSNYRGNCARLDTLMTNKEDSFRLAKCLLELISCF